MTGATKPWESTMSFDAGIPVTLGGTLDLAFIPGVDVCAQVGRTFHLFDWTGVSPEGEFAVASPYVWDLSRLYSAGEVTLLSVPEPTGFMLAVCGALGTVLLSRGCSGKRRITSWSAKFGATIAIVVCLHISSADAERIGPHLRLASSPKPMEATGRRP